MIDKDSELRGRNPEEAAATLRSVYLGAAWTKVPLKDICAFASLLGVSVQMADLNVPGGGAEALITPRLGGGFAVLVDPTPPAGWGTMTASRLREIQQHRFRFRVAHELGHTLFYEQVLGRRPVRFGDSSNEEECFCDRFASALLLPTSVVERCLTPVQLVRVQRSYGVSLEVAAKAWVQTHGRDAALFYWTDDDRRARTQWTSAAARPARAWMKRVNLALAEASPKSSLRNISLLRTRRQALVLAV